MLTTCFNNDYLDKKALFCLFFDYAKASKARRIKRTPVRCRSRFRSLAEAESENKQKSPGELNLRGSSSISFSAD